MRINQVALYALAELHHPGELNAWKHGYDTAGCWDPALAVATLSQKMGNWVDRQSQS